MQTIEDIRKEGKRLRNIVLRQFEKFCEDGEGDIICPCCHHEIGQYYDYAASYIEKGDCPICDCECEDEFCRGKPHDWCEYCKKSDWCDAYSEYQEECERDEYYDRYIRAAKYENV